VPIGLKSGSLNLLETSGPVQVCTGIALPFAFGNEISILKFDEIHAAFWLEDVPLISKHVAKLKI